MIELEAGGEGRSGLGQQVKVKFDVLSQVSQS